MTLDPAVALQNAEQTIASIEPVRATYTAAIEQARNLLEIHGPDDPIVTRAFKLVEGRRQELAQIEKIATLRNHQASMLVGGYVDAVRMVAARMPLGEP